jgi:hypothetical protein
MFVGMGIRSRSRSRSPLSLSLSLSLSALALALRSRSRSRSPLSLSLSAVALRSHSVKPELRRSGMSVASPPGEDSDGGYDVEPQRGDMKNPYRISAA